MTELGSPGRVPPALSGTGAHTDEFQAWDPEGDIAVPMQGSDALYVPTIVRAPPQLPRPEGHPRRQDYPPRGVTAYFDTAAAPHAPTQLSYTAHAVQVSNLSNQWLYFPAARQHVPPNSWGVVLPMIPGTQSAEWRVEIPTGHAAGTLGSSAGPVVTVWYEQWLSISTGAYVVV